MNDWLLENPAVVGVIVIFVVLVALVLLALACMGLFSLFVFLRTRDSSVQTQIQSRLRHANRFTAARFNTRHREHAPREGERGGSGHSRRHGSSQRGRGHRRTHGGGDSSTTQ